MAKKETFNQTSNFKATIIESSRELTAREKVMYKDTQNAIGMVELAENARTQGTKAIINNVKDYVVVAIHNEKSEDVDYNNYMITDEQGNKYVTGSKSFWNAFLNIYEDMKEETEPWGIQLNLIESKNYKGKSILTCSLI